MATENKIDICARGASQNDWVMRQQQLHFVISRAGQSQRQIFHSNHGAIDAGQPERFTQEIDAHALVQEDPKVSKAKQIADQLRIVPLTVISKTAETTVTRT